VAACDADIGRCRPTLWGPRHPDCCALVEMPERCEDDAQGFANNKGWLPGRTVTQYTNSHEGRGQRAEQSETGRVPITINTSAFPCSIRCFSCLPGERPGGCATWEHEGSCSCRDRVQGATGATFLRVRPSLDCMQRDPIRRVVRALEHVFLVATTTTTEAVMGQRCQSKPAPANRFR
jgi:hypothetical protein